MPDEDQAEMLAYVRDICPSCGDLTIYCSDPERPRFPQRSYCFNAAIREVALRRVVKRYKQPTLDDPEPHETDGMQVWIAPEELDPEDQFI